MITQTDYFGRGLPIYTVNRHIDELDAAFRDGSHIIYVNGSYKGNDPVGRLMHDFHCKSAKDMCYGELAKGVRHFKEEGGRNMVCEAVEEYANKKAAEATQKAAIKTTIEDAISYGMDKTSILKKVNEKYGLTKEEAEKRYNDLCAEKISL